jgi:hypothetical protein
MVVPKLVFLCILSSSQLCALALQVCLPGAINAADRRNLTSGGREFPLGIYVGDWPSGRIQAHIFKILLEEKLGINADFTGYASGSLYYWYALLGCEKPSVGSLDDAECPTPEEDLLHTKNHAGIEIWASGNFHLQAMVDAYKYKAPEVIGTIGYYGYEGTFTPGSVNNEAYASEGLALEFYKNYDSNWQDAGQYFTPYNQINKGDLMPCAKEGASLANKVEVGSIIKYFPDPEGVQDVDGGKTAICEDGYWWLSPACRLLPAEKCVPWISGGPGWWLVPMAQKAIAYGMPMAIAVVANWANYTVLPGKYNVSHYWWKPDTTLLALKPQLVLFPTYDKTEWDMGKQNTAGQDQELYKATSYQLKNIKGGGKPLAVLQKMTMSSKQIEGILMDQLVSGEEDFTAACSWLKNNQEAWVSWVPDATDCLGGQGLVDAQGEYVSKRSEAKECARCAPGYFSEWTESDGDANYLCKKCTPGFYSNAFGVLECSVCEVGLFSGEGHAACTRCPQGMYADAQGTAYCKKCDASFTTLFQGAVSKLDCICGKGTYLNDQRSCTACLEGVGLVCDGDKQLAGDTPPVLEPKYMLIPYLHSARLLQQSQNSTAESHMSGLLLPPARLSTYICSSETNCPGGKSPRTWEDVCFGGRVGVGCSVCPDDYFILPKSGRCEPCEEGSAQATYLAMLALPLVCLYLYRKLNKGNGEDEKEEAVEEEARSSSKDQPKKSSHQNLLQHIVGVLVIFNEQVLSVMSDCFGLLLEFIQAATVVTSLTSVELQKQVMMFGALDLGVLGTMLMFDVNTLMDLLGIRLQCVTGQNFTNRYTVELLVPMVIVVVFMINFAAYRIFLHPFQQKLKDKVRGKKGICNKILRFMAYATMTWPRVMNALGTQVSVLFIGVTSLSMSVFVTFEHPDDGGPKRYSLRRFPEVLYDSEERSSMVPLAICGLVVYTFGVIAGALYVCYTAPSKAHNPNFVMKYYFLIDGFRPERWWWGTVILMKGLLLNLALAVFSSPQVQNVMLVTIFLVSLAMLFTFGPWPKSIQNIIDSAGHLACSLMLATTSFFIVTANEDGKSFIKGLAVAAKDAPLVVAIMCMLVPVIHFAFSKTRAIHKYRLGQRLRDLLLLVTRRTNNEINSFLDSLDDSDTIAIEKAMNVIYTRMYFMHPSKHFAGNRIITETEDFMEATDEAIMLKVEHDMITEKRDDGTSICERGLMQWFVEMMIAGNGNSQMKTGLENTDVPISLGGLFDALDEPTDTGEIAAVLTKDEFINGAIKMNPKIMKEQAEQVFHLMDINNGGSVSRDEFDIIMSGMTFTGQRLDHETKEGKYFREAPPNEQLENQRKICSRLAVMFETGNFSQDISNSIEQQRRMRADTVVVDSEQVKLNTSTSTSIKTTSIQSSSILASADTVVVDSEQIKLRQADSSTNDDEFECEQDDNNLPKRGYVCL